jgi:hypothetical protein
MEVKRFSKAESSAIKLVVYPVSDKTSASPIKVLLSRFEIPSESSSPASLAKADVESLSPPDYPPINALPLKVSAVNVKAASSSSSSSSTAAL